MLYYLYKTKSLVEKGEKHVLSNFKKGSKEKADEERNFAGFYYFGIDLYRQQCKQYDGGHDGAGPLF